jgi:hypothetical protein
MIFVPKKTNQQHDKMARHLNVNKTLLTHKCLLQDRPLTVSKHTMISMFKPQFLQPKEKRHFGSQNNPTSQIKRDR